jgi:translation initiation factor IF-2
LAVRIYSLAKELKLDSKELVDLCTQIGISGKGSALASLTDEEEVKVREYFRNPGGKPAARGNGAAGVAAPERPAQPARVGRMPVISSPRQAGPLAGARRPVREDDRPAPPEPAAGPTVEAADAVEEAPAPIAADGSRTHASPAADPDVPRSPGPLARVMRRDDYVGPGPTSGKPPVIEDLKPTPRGGGSKPAGAPPQRSRPAVKLAPMPTVEPPKPGKATAGGPQVIKPDLKLPADALKASKSGSKPLAAHLRRHEDALETVKRAKELPPAEETTKPGARSRRVRPARRRKTRLCWAVAKSGSSLGAVRFR